VLGLIVDLFELEYRAIVSLEFLIHHTLYFYLFYLFIDTIELPF